MTRFAWRGRLLLLASSLALSALVAEALLRFVFHSAPLVDLDIYRWDAEGQLALRPGIRRRHVTRHWDVTIAIDPDGFRDRLTPLPAPGRPVLSLGDSFAFGWGVELADTYAYRLEEGGLQPHPVRVVKAGIPATGTTDQLALFRSLQGRHHPRLVLLGFFAGNDFIDVKHGGTAQFEVEAGLLVRKDLETTGPVTRLGRRLTRTSRVAQLIRALASSLVSSQNTPKHPGRTIPDASADAWLREYAGVFRRQYPEALNRAVSQTLQALDAMHAGCREIGADLLVVVIPRSQQVTPGGSAEIQALLGITTEELDLEHPQHLLNEWARVRGAAVLDLLPAMRHHAQTHPDPPLYYSPDAHLTPEGHRLVAAQISEELAQRGWPHP